MSPHFFKSENFTAFTMSMIEYVETIPTLWKHVMGSFFFSKVKQHIDFFFLVSISDFAHDHPEYIAEKNSLKFISSDDGQNYNLCHC